VVPITAHLRVRTLEQAWLGIMREIMERGREYRKDGGSRAGLLRKALDFCTVEITHPETRPLVPLAKPGCLSPCTEDMAEEYLREYLYNTNPPAEKEHYTYAQYLTPALHATAAHFAKNGLFVQQAVMPVGDPLDVAKYLEDREVSIPCLRLIDCRIIRDRTGSNRLCYYIYFRAWNHFGAFPLNMAGIQLLKEIHAVLITEKSGQDVAPGPTFAMSKDLHINDLEWDSARAWL